MAEGRDKKFSVEEGLTLTNIMGEQNIGRPDLNNHQFMLTVFYIFIVHALYACAALLISPPIISGLISTWLNDLPL